MTLREVAEKLKRAYKKDVHRKAPSESFWGPGGQFTIAQRGVAWSIEGLPKGEADMKNYGNFATKEQARETAEVLAGIRPDIKAEEIMRNFALSPSQRKVAIKPVIITDRRGLVEHSRNL